MSEVGMSFDNGLDDAQEYELNDIIMDLVSLKLRIEDLGGHRSYALAITKLDEAGHWLRDRKHRPE